MSQTFLERYKVAPAPSRDYYGLKIQDNEVKLFHWPIRQRPHKPPITSVTSFGDWRSDTILQSQIEHIFGHSWLEYTKNIIDNKKSLLTLPKKIIKHILTFLPAKDISQLFLLCQAFHEILDNEEIWELIFKKVKGEDFHRAQKRYGMSHGWKQLLKETQDIKIETSISKTLRAKKPPSFRGNHQKSVQTDHIKSELEIEKISFTKKAAPTSLSLQTLKLNLESTEDTPKPLHKNPRATESLGVRPDNQSEKNQKSVNVLTLQSTDITLKPKRPEPEKRKNFKARPAPRSIYQSGRNEDKIPHFRGSSHRKVSSSGTSSLSSLKSREIPLENLVKKSLRDFKQSKDLFSSEFEWLTGSPSLNDSGDCLNVLDTKWITKAEKLKNEYELTDSNNKSRVMNGSKTAKELIPKLKDLESKKCSTEDLGQNNPSKGSKTSVSCQSMGERSLKTKVGFDLLNSEFLKRGFDLQPRMRGSNYSHLEGRLKNLEMK